MNSMIKNSTKILGGALLMGLVSIGHVAAATQGITIAGFGEATTADTNANRGAGRLISGERFILARFGGGITGGIGGAKGPNEKTEFTIEPASQDSFKTDSRRTSPLVRS